MADEFGSLETLRTMFVLGTPPSVSRFPAHAVQVVACRCGSKTWWCHVIWDQRVEIPLVCLYVHMFYICVV